MRCASRKTDETWPRRALSGVSMGMSRFADEARDAVDARGLKLATEDLCETAADCRDALVEVRAGMVGVF